MSRHVRVGVVRDVRRDLRKRVPNDGLLGGFTTVRAGQESADIVIEVDVIALATALGERAMKSKRGVSKMQNGAVIVRATNRRRIPQ